MSLNWGVWEGAKSCTGSVTPGAQALLAWCREEYLIGSSMGIYNCRTVVGGSTTSLHGEGRALDWGMPVVSGRGHPQGHEIVQRLGTHGKRLGVQAVIFDRRIWSQVSPDGRAYTGLHPHYDHLHIELTWNAAHRLTLATLREVLGAAVTPEDIQKVAEQTVDLLLNKTFLDKVDSTSGSSSRMRVANYLRWIHHTGNVNRDLINSVLEAVDQVAEVDSQQLAAAVAKTLNTSLTDIAADLGKKVGEVTASEVADVIGRRLLQQEDA